MGRERESTEIVFWDKKKEMIHGTGKGSAEIIFWDEKGKVLYEAY